MSLLACTRVSPTPSRKAHCEWFVTFLKTCWDLPTCDVETIDVFSVHYYECPQHDYLSYFDYNDTSDGHNVKNQLLTLLDDYAADQWPCPGRHPAFMKKTD